MIPVLCIDSNNKPNEIPLSKWIQKSMIYHITHVYFHTFQSLQGVDLHEIKLDESCYPYETYKLSRFAIKPEDLERLIEMIKNCSELNNFEIKELLEESKLQVNEPIEI